METGDQEVFVDFRTNKNGEIVIKLKDISASKTILDEDDNYTSILRVFVDTISRPRFYRRFPKTKEFLK